MLCVTTFANYLQAYEQELNLKTCRNKLCTGYRHHDYDPNRIESTANVICNYSTNLSYDSVKHTKNPAYVMAKPEVKDGDNCYDTNPMLR